MIRGRILVLAALATAACEVPTEPPMWEQTWVVPGEAIVVGVGSLLPGGVALNSDSTAFETTVAGIEFDMSLAEMCAACVALDGSTAAKPEFTHTFNTVTTLPSALVTASVTGDRFDVALAHNLNFDPLRPSSDPAAPRGFIVIEVTSDGNVVARDTIHGADRAFPADITLDAVVPIRVTDVTNALDVAVEVFSPAGDPVVIESSDTLGVNLLPATVTISEATVEATAIAVNAPAAEIELAVDSALASRVQSGALRLDVQNPFSLEGTLDLTFDLGTETIQKTMTLTPGTSSTDVEFTGDQLQNMLAAGTVAVTAEGTLASPDGTLTVAPGQELVMESLFEIVVLIGGSEEEGV